MSRNKKEKNQTKHKISPDKTVNELGKQNLSHL